MQIVIPMSGFGERFRAAGYSVPKPLIEVDGKPIIQHVTEMFPGEHSFLFICNEDHLANPAFRMRETLEGLNLNSRIVSIPPHKLGPVHAVLQATKYIDLDAPTVVNYADFTCRWSFAEFESDIRSRGLDGSVPAYRGFHPHSGGTTNYAYIQETDMQLTRIREKQPFTASKTSEFASTGTYFFSSARMMLHYLAAQVEADVSVNGEFYVSSAFEMMASDGLKVGVFEVRHFMQWGTPNDLAEYEYYSDIFQSLPSLEPGSAAIPGVGSSIFLASGLGSRFSQAGYDIPKPLLEISGRSILSHAFSQAGNSELRILSRLSQSQIFPEPSDSNRTKIVELERLSRGQADSALQATLALEEKQEEAFTIFPSDTLFLDSEGLSSIAPFDSNQLIVWAMRAHPFASSNPESFGWVWSEGNSVNSAIKRKPPVEDAQLISGAFTFSNASTFTRLFEFLDRNNIQVNGELYLDSMIEAANEIGVKVTVFCPEVAISFGTPQEFETYRYWQSCFDQWEHHPYSLELDPFLDKSQTEQVRRQLGTTSHSPFEWQLK